MLNADSEPDGAVLEMDGAVSEESEPNGAVSEPDGAVSEPDTKGDGSDPLATEAAVAFSPWAASLWLPAACPTTNVSGLFPLVVSITTPDSDLTVTCTCTESMSSMNMYESALV